MTARDRLLRVRRAMMATLVVRAALAAGAAWLLAQWVLAGSLASAPVAALAAIVVVVWQMLPVRWAASPGRVALWVEERNPPLRYALVTAVESPSLAPRDARVEAQALHTPWWREAYGALARSLAVPALLFALALWVMMVVPLHGIGSSATAVKSGAGSARASRVVRDPLATVRAEIASPAYSGRAARAIDDPTSIDALVGSRITLRGDGDASTVEIRADSIAQTVQGSADEWTATFVMPTRPSVLRLHSRAGRERLIVLAPVPDAPPVVTLQLPMRDTIVRRATGALLLRAQLRDDIGLRDAAFDLVISSGEGENFTFRSATIARRALDGRTDGTLDARISLDSLALKPGDVLQIRAVAHDANNVTGPGLGSSDTRALRVARVGEADSVAVDGAPPAEAEGQVLSQRMLIMLAEALVRRRSSLARPVMITESQRIAGDQRRLRKRVGDVVFQRTGGQPLGEEGTDDEPAGKLTPEELLKRAEAAGTKAGSPMDIEGDETPILAVNKPLLEAFNAMWDAGRALEQGEPAQALPPMRRALAAIERARQAERIYLRGRPATVIVDVAKARLAGKDKGTATVREARSAMDPRALRRSERFARASALVAGDPAAAADSLLLMRVDALSDDPALARALDDAARAIRRDGVAAGAVALARVRRVLAGPVVQRALSPWGGAP